MEQTPFFSVMILCYNYSKLLNNALDACAKQTYKDFEIVMINNASTDETEEVFKKFCCDNPDIRTTYVKVEVNKGPTNGWNTGLPFAKGQYLLFNDADDWMEPNCLEKLYEEAKKTRADRIVGEYQEVLPDGTVSRIRKNSGKVVVPSVMLQGVAFSVDIVRTNCLAFPENVLVPYDFDFVLNFVLCEKTKPSFVKETIYNYYNNPDSITQKIQQNKNYIDNLETVAYQNIEIAETASKKSQEKHIFSQIEYMCVRNNYAAIFAGFKYFEKKEAVKYYFLVKERLEKAFPNYHSNKYLMPFFNGYESSGSFAVWVLILAEKINLMIPICSLLSRIM